jgi:hypothetical protein
LVVDRETEAMISAAMEGLDDVALIARALVPTERPRLLADLREIDEMACAIHADLFRAGEGHGSL